MSWIWPIVGVLIVAAWTFAVIDIIRRRHAMSGTKIAAWVIVILVFPVLGAIVYFIVHGRGGATDAPRVPS
jgi:hypothetical protein